MLHTYFKRFIKAILEISGLDDGTMWEALKKGLKHISLFKKEICTKYPSTIQNALHRVKGFIDLEEENERVEEELSWTQKEVMMKACEKRQEQTTRHELTQTPRQHES